VGLGVGVLGLSSGTPWLAALGFAGALLHVVNHAIFKGLLFLGAGAVLAATGTRDMERLGGLLHLARWTGATFLVGAAAISGLPPLNGFVSEFLILVGAARGVAGLPAETVVPLLVVVGALALIGGLASACFAKAFGIVFLGTPRAPLARAVADPGALMMIPMATLAAACPAIGLLSPWIVPGLGAVVAGIAGGGGPAMIDPLGEAGAWLARFVACAIGLVVFTGLLPLLPRVLLKRREGAGGGNLGLRLPRSDATDAVHRLVIRRAPHESLQAPPGDASAGRAPCGSLPPALLLLDHNT